MTAPLDELSEFVAGPLLGASCVTMPPALGELIFVF
jgi:hypothetical protein